MRALNGPIRIHPHPAPALRPIYPFLHAVSFLLFGAAAGLWIMAIRESFSTAPDHIAVLMAAYFGAAAGSLALSCAAVMARTGARWGQVSHFLFLLPVISILIPIAGTAVCAYCLKNVSRPALPPLVLGGHRKRRRGGRPPGGNAVVYDAVPLHGSSASGILMLSFAVLSHVFLLVRGVIGLFNP